MLAYIALLLPIILSAIACFIAFNALSKSDEISDVVEVLTQTNVIEESTKLRAGSLQRSNASAIAISKASLHIVLSFLVVAQLFVASTAPPAYAGRLEFDQRRTEVRFVFKMAYSTQRGRFTKVSGTLDYDDTAPEKAKISASIFAASLTTGETLVDNELKGPAFFNVTAAPVITFKSLAVQPLSATMADVSGELTVNGITKPVMLKVKLNLHDDPALKYDVGSREFIATTRIQRSAFNMTDYQSMVDDDVDIEIAAIVRPR